LGGPLEEVLPDAVSPAPPMPPRPAEPRFSRRRRLLVWGGAGAGLLGSLLILYLSWQREAEDLRRMIDGAARRYGLDPDLVEAVVYTESKGDARAVSRAQAYGLMQLRIGTATEVAGRAVTAAELFEPELNLDLGCRYLRQLIDRYRGDLVLALMAYNAGPGSVARWRAAEPDPLRILKDHAYGETRRYVVRVLRRLQELQER